MQTISDFPGKTVIVDLADRSYPIYVGWDCFARLHRAFQQHCPARRALIISDTNVAPIYAQAIMDCLAPYNPAIITVAPGEKSKSSAIVEDIYDQLFELNAERSDAIVALGGGVVGDLAGYVAATFKRGMKFVQIPTSLLAMVDSSVGGKTGINHPRGKNMIGAFYQPQLVFADTQTLTTLPRRELGCGLAETVKHAVIRDENFFHTLETQTQAILDLQPQTMVDMVTLNCQIKAAVVSADEREAGLRGILNLGHTIGHTIETVLTPRHDYHHGEAVSLGIVAAVNIAANRKLITNDTAQRIISLLEKLQLPIAMAHPLPVTEMYQAMSQDKKIKDGKITFVLPTSLGDTIFANDLTEQEITQTIASFAEKSLITFLVETIVTKPLNPDRDRLAKWLRLHLTENVGPKTFAALLKRFDNDLDAILKANANQLTTITGVGAKTAHAIIKSREQVNPEDELELAESLSVRILTIQCPEYPELLRQIASPPHVIYLKGQLARADKLAIAMVGSRNASFYGLEQTARLSTQLAAAGFTIVSGLARGIDTAAHNGALSVEGRTIAVQGCGLAQVYPKENQKLAETITQNGALISELPLRYEPLANTFRSRNRIISGLSLGTIVVEAAHRSGALATAAYATEQNREVMAVPGNVESPGSFGPHQLIKDGAALVHNIEDVLQCLGHYGRMLEPHALNAARKTREKIEPDLFTFDNNNLTANLSPLESAVFQQLSRTPVHIDEIVNQCELDAGNATAVLIALQLKGLARQTPGNYYQQK